MAGDWIKMRTDLQTHPKIVRILSALRPQSVGDKSESYRVIGGLHAAWTVFDTHSTDGVLRGYTPELLDHVIGWQGFSRAMEAVGWLLFDGLETLSLPEFEAHNGQSAKRRAEDQKRKKNSRHSVRNLSADDADRMRTREEKRREDKEKKEMPAVADVLCGIDPQVAADFRRLRAAKKAALTQTAVNGIIREAGKAGMTLEAALRVCCERGWTGFKAEWVKGGPAAPADSYDDLMRRAI